jgi:hypothetical protein
MDDRARYEKVKLEISVAEIYNQLLSRDCTKVTAIVTKQKYALLLNIKYSQEIYVHNA